MSQYALNLSLPPVFTAGSFFVSDCNRQAWQWIESWPNWQSLIREHGGSMLMTSMVPAPNLPFSLPDLTSRLLALPSVGIDQPDDDALAGAIRKQFSDRQMKVDEEVIKYLLPRMQRSFLKAKELVELLDAKALAEGKNITIPFVKRVWE